MKTAIYLILVLLFATSCVNKNREQWWPQFRGPDGSGIANQNARPPVEFEDKNLEWKTDLPVGFSSPVIWDDKIFITGFTEDKKELLTICLNRKDGKILWQKSVFPDTLERYLSFSNPATNTVVTDGERVFIYFASCGLICYNMEGKEQWKYPKPSTKFPYNNATSPIVAEDKLIYLNDEGSKRYLLALDKVTGQVKWKTTLKLIPFPDQGGQSTPCVYNNIIVIHRVGEVSGYSVNDGSNLWNYKILTEGEGSPVMAGNKVVVNCWHNFGEEVEHPKLPDFDYLIQKFDSNNNGRISKSELPDDIMIFQRIEIKEIEGTVAPLKEYFGDFDKNADNEFDREEWKALTDLMKTYETPSGLVAINSEYKGQLSDSLVLWTITKHVPEIPSPIFYKSRIYMIADGGFLTCINPEKGNIIYQTRVGNPGAYFATPVAANGLIYLFGYNGRLTVIKAGDKFKKVAQHNFKGNIVATPAIIGNSIYIRTKKGLLAYSD
jgi:outer membrane protein assembly factor BamB